MIRWMLGGVVRCGLCETASTCNWRLGPGLWITLLLIMSHDALVHAMFPFVGYEPRPIIQDRPGCYMDGTFRAFGDRWSPVLEPQGLMVCVKCQCLAVEKKGVLQTKGDIMCRNIKDLCPEPDCEHPTLKQGKCCKSCPGSDDFESTFTLKKGGTLSNDVYAFDDSRFYEAQEFQALLVGRQVLAGPVKTRAVAMALIQVVKGRIQFALRYSRLERPQSFILQDIHGSVLFDKSIRRDLKGDRKVCAVWTKIPGFYLKYFRQEKLYATITTSRYPHGIVSGKITPKSPANKETFNAILTPARADGSGGRMLVDYAPETRLLSYVTTLEGVRGSWKRGNFHVAVLKGSTVVYQTGGSMVATTGIISGSWRLSKRHRKQIARGRLHVRVTFLDLPSLEGIIQPRLTCSVFQAVLSSSQTVDSKMTYSSGSAVLRLGEDGRLEYSIQVSGLPGNITRIRLEGAASKYEYGPKLVGNLFKPDSSTEQFPVGEWRNGTYRRLEAADVFRLLNDQLYVNIATTRHRISQLRGKLVSFQYNEHFVHGAVPASLVPVSEPGRGGAAHVWLSMDIDCVLRFDATVAAAQRRPGSFDVLLGSQSNQQRVFALKQQATKLGKVASAYTYATGEVTNIPDDLLVALDRGQAFVQINAKNSGVAVFKGNLTLTNSCWRYSNDVDIDYAEEDLTDLTSSDHDHVPVCNFEGHLYEDGSMWLPDISPECTTCSCVAGKIMCQPMICPSLTCQSPVVRSGDCCPSCPYESEQETCYFGKDPRKYRVHSTWFPYLPLEGFTKCAVCRCFPGGKVECNKSPCPALDCPKSQWLKSQTDPCCYECRSPLPLVAPEEEPQRDQNVNGVCSFLKDTKANGETWHPTIQPFGHMKCFLCECQDGAVSCGRVKCPELKCSEKVRQAGQCCEECMTNLDTSPATVTDQVPHRTNGTRTNKGCKFGDKQYRHRQRWQPISSPTGSRECAVCQCQEGSVKCRLRCPRVCRQDLSQDPCCRHCSDKVKAKARNRNLVTKTSANTEQTTSGPSTGQTERVRTGQPAKARTGQPEKARTEPNLGREQRQGQEQERMSKKPGLIDKSDFLTMLS